MGKYTPLEEYISKQKANEITLSFSEIEEIIKDKLPPSAHKYEVWWSNSFSHSQSEAWLNAGYNASVDLENKETTFLREQVKEIQKFPYQERKTAFNNRWNIPQIDSKKSSIKFKNRFQNIVSRKEFSINVVEDFYNFVGEIIPDLSLYPLIRDSSNLICDIFRKTSNLQEYIKNIQELFWALEKNNDSTEISNLFNDFKDVLELSPSIGISLSKNGDEVSIYPSGVKLLDNEIINKDLQWLTPFPKALELFKKSLSDYLTFSGDQSEARTILDNLRASLEKLVQKKLGNKISLENNQKELKEYLQLKNLHPNIIRAIGLFSHFDHYIKFMNDVKHSKDINYSSAEIEYMIYQTGIFMRLLLEVDEKAITE